MNRRVVVTGLGLVTPLGIGVRQTWEALCAGKSGIAEITRFDASAYMVAREAMVQEVEYSASSARVPEVRIRLEALELEHIQAEPKP